MIELTDRERKEDLIELASEKPKIHALAAELSQALTDVNSVYSRWDNCYNYWHARWDNQTADGCKHAPGDAMEDPFPWEGASDTRIRLCEKLVRQHVMVGKIAIYRARLQAEAIRPAMHGREASQGTTLLKWMVDSHMKENVRREVPLGLTWRFVYGASLMAVEWEQEDRIDEHEMTLPLLDQFIEAAGGGANNMPRIMETIMDPAWEENYLGLLMQVSDMLSRREARQVLQQLRTERSAMVPVRYTYKSQPRWTAKRIGVDVLFPLGVRDLQAAPWVADREWVTRPELLSRIRTRDYDPKFVEELLRHKGETSNALWTGRTMGERAYVTGNYSGAPEWDGSFRNMYELYHVRYRASAHQATCLYETVFNPNAIGRDRDNPLYALHEKFNYDHGMYPYIVQRMEHTDAPIYSSEGIPEKAYTWEQEIKVQCDGRTDLTALELGPPLIVPKARQKTLGGYPLPRSVLGVDRGSDYQFMQLPPASLRSIEIERGVEARAREFFPLFGADLDPELKQAYREELIIDLLGEYCLIGDHTFKLLQQYEADEEVQAVVGTLRRPFRVDKQTIQKGHEIRATYDSRNLNEDYAKEKLGLISQAMSLDTSGRYDMSELAQIGLEIIDPSIVDRVSRPQEEATEQERKDELNAISQAMNGIEAPPPRHGNFQLRLQVLTETLQSPQVSQEMAQKEFSKKILENRFKYYSNQIQQTQANPQIGRTLAVSANNPREALPTTAQSGGGY